jgi:hypothetical protein
MFPAGTYGATAAFQPRLVDHPEADDVLERSVLRIVSKIIP